jgi:hypothetical protein
VSTILPLISPQKLGAHWFSGVSSKSHCTNLFSLYQLCSGLQTVQLILFKLLKWGRRGRKCHSETAIFFSR